MEFFRAQAKRDAIVMRLTCAVMLTLAVCASPIVAQAPQPASTTTPDGTTALHLAVRSNDLPAVQRLLRSGANPSLANRYGITPLSLAAESASAEIFSALLKAGADVKALLPGGQTILMTAARSGNVEAVKMLLDRGADANVRESNNQETALMWAAAENHPDVVRLLASRGAQLDARSALLQYKQDRFGLEGVVTILPRGNWTALMFAARQGALDAAQALVEAGAGINLTDPDGTTPLIIAIINSHYDTAAMLTNKGADPNIADSSGMAALYAAADMSTLIEIYGRPRQKTNDRLTAIDLMKVLLDHGANPNAALKAPTIQRVHTPGDRNLGEGATPLMRAARNGDAPAIRLLIERGADPTLAQKSRITALMLAAGLGRGLGVFNDEYATEAQQYEAVQVLLDHHVDVNATNDAGQTALHFAALSMDSVVELLAKNGAKLDATDRQGRTPMDMANGKGGPGRAGQAASPRQSTIELLRKLGGR
jgi:ankyrin repeat protein